jgi:hypothetical protein
VGDGRLPLRLCRGKAAGEFSSRALRFFFRFLFVMFLLARAWSSSRRARSAPPPPRNGAWPQRASPDVRFRRGTGGVERDAVVVFVRHAPSSSCAAPQFWGDSPTDLFEAIQAGDCEAPPDVSDGFRAVLFGLLERRPDERWTIDEIERDEWIHSMLPQAQAARRREVALAHAEAVSISDNERRHSFSRASIQFARMPTELGIKALKQISGFSGGALESARDAARDGKSGATLSQHAARHTGAA